ncbi:MAG: rubredoxin [Promethearchaeota archaeon]
MAIYRCKRCNYLYIDEQNECCFEDIIEEKFKCPRCKCSKRLFEKIEN